MNTLPSDTTKQIASSAKPIELKIFSLLIRLQLLPSFSSAAQS